MDFKELQNLLEFDWTWYGEDFIKKKTSFFKFDYQVRLITVIGGRI